MKTEFTGPRSHKGW